MDLQQIKEDIQALTQSKFQLIGHVKKEGRRPTPREGILIAELDGALQGLQAELDKPADDSLGMKLYEGQTLGGGSSSGSVLSTRKDGGFSLIPPNGRKDYKSLFGNSGYQWPDRDTNFFGAALSGRHHPGLILNSMSETVPSDGGFLVPTEQAANIHAVSL